MSESVQITAQVSPRIELLRDGNVITPLQPCRVILPNGEKRVNFISTFRATAKGVLELFKAEPHEFETQSDEPPLARA